MEKKDKKKYNLHLFYSVFIGIVIDMLLIYFLIFNKIPQFYGTLCFFSLYQISSFISHKFLIKKG